MVDGIQGDGGLSPAQKKVLGEEYKQAAEGFQAALDKYSELSSPLQKQEYKNVMNQYMRVMQDVAADLRRERVSRQTDELKADLQALDQSDGAKAKLQEHLTKAKNGE